MAGRETQTDKAATWHSKVQRACRLPEHVLLLYYFICSAQSNPILFGVIWENYCWHSARATLPQFVTRNPFSSFQLGNCKFTKFLDWKFEIFLAPPPPIEFFLATKQTPSDGGAIVQWPIRFQCVGVYISTGIPCIYIYSWPHANSRVASSRRNFCLRQEKCSRLPCDFRHQSVYYVKPGLYWSKNVAKIPASWLVQFIQ